MVIRTSARKPFTGEILSLQKEDCSVVEKLRILSLSCFLIMKASISSTCMQSANPLNRKKKFSLLFIPPPYHSFYLLKYTIKCIAVYRLIWLVREGVCIAFLLNCCPHQCVASPEALTNGGDERLLPPASSWSVTEMMSKPTVRP